MVIKKGIKIRGVALLFYLLQNLMRIHSVAKDRCVMIFSFLHCFCSILGVKVVELNCFVPPGGVSGEVRLVVEGQF